MGGSSDDGLAVAEYPMLPIREGGELSVDV
jgi:hypothetical protein